MLSIEFATSKKPGAKHNEDLFGFKGDTFWLLDGATSTDGPPLERDAYWLVNEMDAALNSLWSRDLPVADMAAKACEIVAARWPGSSDLRPVAAMALWRVTDGRLTAAITGNVSLLVESAGRFKEYTDTRVAVGHAGASDALMAALTREISFESPEFAALRKEMKLREAGSLDAKGPNWLVSAALREPSDFVTIDLELHAPMTVLAASDGFMELRRFLGNPPLDNFMEDVQCQALWAWLEHIRHVELQPESGKLFPRTKRHDDATAALIKLQ